MGNAAGQIANVTQVVAILIIINVALRDTHVLATSARGGRNGEISVLPITNVNQTAVRNMESSVLDLNLCQTAKIYLVIVQTTKRSNSFLFF